MYGACENALVAETMSGVRVVGDGGEDACRRCPVVATTIPTVASAPRPVANQRRRWRRRASLITPRSISKDATGATLVSTMIGVKIDRHDPAPLHEQVAAEIRRAIADGEAEAGDRLPPARDMAAVLGVNRNTVLRALRLLRDEELLEFRRGQAVRVTGTPARGAVLSHAAELLHLARKHGYKREELIHIITQLP